MRGSSFGTPKSALVVFGPKQLLRRKIEIPYADAGSFDAQPKTLVSNGIFGRGMLDGGHVWPSLPGEVEGYQDARRQASALSVLPFSRDI